MRPTSAPALWACILCAVFVVGLDVLPAEEAHERSVTPQSSPGDRGAGATDLAPGGLTADAEREIGKAQAFLEVLHQTEARLAAEDDDERDHAGAALNKAALLEKDLRAPVAGAVDAGRLYGRIVEELKEARPRLRQALDALRAPDAVPHYEQGIEPATLRGTEAASQGLVLEQLQAQIAGEESRLRQRVANQRWLAVDIRAQRVERLDALRIQCLAALSPLERSEILGLGRAGVAQLRREMDQLSLSMRLYLVRRAHDAHMVRRLHHDVFAVGTATYSLFKLAILLAGFLYLKRRGTAFLSAVRRALFREPRGIRWTRRAEAVLGAVSVLAPWSIFLLMLQGFRWVAGDAFAWPEVSVPYQIAVLYGVYRLASDALVGIVVGAARRYQLSLDEERTAKLIGSIRSVLRVVAGIEVVLLLSARILGRGALYHMVVDLAWFLVLAAVLQVLAGWRSIIAEAYLRAGPPGRLAALVRSTSGRWYGVFVAAASFLWLAGRAGVILARDFALGFDQTRRALAFLFRRRMERHAERQGYAPGVVGSLSSELLRVFSDAPVSEGPLAVDHFPGFGRLESAIKDWEGGQSGGAFLIVGEPGIGKTSWLGRMQDDGVPVVRLAPGSRLTKPSDLADFLGLAIDPALGARPSLEQLRRTLTDGPPRVMVVDRGERLFLSRIGGYDAFEQFTSLVERTCRKVFWVCGLDLFAYEHLVAVRPDLAVFRIQQILTAWNESLIHDLIRSRIVASGTELTYEDLVVDRIEGVSTDTRLLESEEGYIRLLWDYSDGNPAVALHFWLRSLVPESPERVRVRLFRSPSPEALEDGREEGAFLLAAVVVHGDLTVAEAAAVTGYPEALCRIHVNRLLDLGVLNAEGDRCRVSTHWQRTVIRLLKRKNLIAD